jgi:putative aldouronate transport system substrate-binding protein
LTSDSYKASAASPDVCEIYPMANVVLEEGDTIKTQNNAYGGRGDGDWCITTCDESIIPQIVSYINWFFTDEGSMISNFGTEGETYTIDADGNIHYTDLILKDPNGYGSMAVYAIFTNNNDNPFYFRFERTELTYDNEVEATVYDTWLSNMTSEYIASYTLNTDETSAYNALATDVVTVLQEYMTKFMTGDMELTEESWQSFQDKLASLGLEEMREIVQTAYDRSLEA